MNQVLVSDLDDPATNVYRRSLKRGGSRPVLSSLAVRKAGPSVHSEKKVSRDHSPAQVTGCYNVTHPVSEVLNVEVFRNNVRTLDIIISAVLRLNPIPNPDERAWENEGY